MQRKVYLEGQLAEKYGEVLSINATSVKDIIKVIEANDPTFKKYVLDCAEKGIGFSIEVAGTSVSEQDLIFPMQKGDVFISPIPAGSKSGGGKILAAIAIASLFFIPGVGVAAAGAAQGAATSGFLGATAAASAGGAVTLSTAGTIAANLAISLAITGIQQLMAPDPSTDEGPESYLYNADNQNIVDGDPMPLAYGRVRVPGRAISFSVMNEDTFNSTAYSYANILATQSGGGADLATASAFEDTADSDSLLGSILTTDSDGTIKTFPTPNVILE